jgi:hypothetical protein
MNLSSMWMPTICPNVMNRPAGLPETSLSRMVCDRMHSSAHGDALIRGGLTNAQGGRFETGCLDLVHSRRIGPRCVLEVPAQVPDRQVADELARFFDEIERVVPTAGAWREAGLPNE